MMLQAVNTDALDPAQKATQLGRPARWTGAERSESGQDLSEKKARHSQRRWLAKRLGAAPDRVRGHCQLNAELEIAAAHVNGTNPASNSQTRLPLPPTGVVRNVKGPRPAAEPEGIMLPIVKSKRRETSIAVSRSIHLGLMRPILGNPSNHDSLRNMLALTRRLTARVLEQDARGQVLPEIGPSSAPATVEAQSCCSRF